MAKIYCLVLLMLFCLLGLWAIGCRGAVRSPRDFVQDFYGWYVPRARKQGAPAAWDIVRKRKRFAFSPQLAKLLAEDSAAQARCEELVGLDFDPFLNTQDPARHYEVGGISHRGQYYRADIYSVRAGERGQKPDVTAELSSDHGHWVFVNFYYSDGTNLLAILMSPRPKCSAPRSLDKKP